MSTFYHGIDSRAGAVEHCIEIIRGTYVEGVDEIHIVIWIVDALVEVGVCQGDRGIENAAEVEITRVGAKFKSLVCSQFECISIDGIAGCVVDIETID